MLEPGTAAAQSAAQSNDMHPSGWFSRARLIALFWVGAGCFLIPNVLTVVRPSWFLVECVVLLAVFALGVWSLDPSPRDA
jgi:hypothetical protein